jgi:hypothetical protein
VKTCGTCKLELDLSNFYQRSRGGYSHECKECAKKRSRENHAKFTAADPIKFERQKTNRYLKHTYNITLEDYEQMFLEQEGKCAICKEEQQLGIRLCVDHDHKCCPGEKSCGKCVRKLLCNRCNTTLGKVNEDTTLLYGMINYIESGGEYDR